MTESLLPALFAVLAHELGHLVFMFLMKVRFCGAGNSLWGIKITADYTKSTYLKELCVSSGGALSNFLFAYIFFMTNADEYAYAMLAYGIFNLLPAHFLDGGDIVRVLMLMSPVGVRVSESVCRYLSISVTLFIWVIAVYFAMNTANIALLITVFYMMIACFFDKSA